MKDADKSVRMIHRLKTATFLLLLLGVFSYSVKAQSKNMNAAIAAGLAIPIGSFSSTHIAGLGLEYSPARHVFGLIKRKKIAFTYNGGLTYYLGKKEIVSNYPYKYPNYLFIHAYGGILYKPAKKTEFMLTGGPALGIYNGATRFTIGSKLETNYLVSKKIIIGPGISLVKEPGTTALWSVLVKTTIAL